MQNDPGGGFIILSSKYLFGESCDEFTVLVDIVTFKTYNADEILKNFMFTELASKYGIKLLLKFGSTVSGFTHSNSDTDVAYLATTELEFEQLTDFMVELTKIFGTEIDLVNLKKAGPLIAMQISQNCQLLYGSQEEFLKFKIKTSHEYNDFEPYFRLQNETNKKLINNNAK